MRIHFAISQSVGGGNLRGVWPAWALREAGHEASSGAEVPDDLDVLVVHRPLARNRAGMVDEARRRGVHVVCDEDDALDLAVDIGNEIAREHWTEDVREIHDTALAQADAVTVSTAPLAEHYRHLNPNITVVRNRLPRRYVEMQPQRLAVPTVGYMGLLSTHRHDMRWLRPAMADLVPVLETLGDEWAPLALGIPGSNVLDFTYYPDELYAGLSRWWVGLVPLVDHPFNHSKSWLKALEYMTVGTVPIARRLPEQELLITDGVDGFLVDEPAEMVARANLLAADEATWHQMSAAARARADAEAIEKHVQAWEDALR